MYYCYLIKSQKSGKLYYGFTGDLQRRFAEHNAGKSPYTSRWRPWLLVYYEAYQSEKDARKREASLKLNGRALAQLKLRIKDSIDHEV